MLSGYNKFPGGYKIGNKKLTVFPKMIKLAFYKLPVDFIPFL